LESKVACREKVLGGKHFSRGPQVTPKQGGGFRKRRRITVGTLPRQKNPFSRGKEGPLIAVTGKYYGRFAH